MTLPVLLRIHQVIVLQLSPRESFYRLTITDRPRKRRKQKCNGGQSLLAIDHQQW